MRCASRGSYNLPARRPLSPPPPMPLWSAGDSSIPPYLLDHGWNKVSPLISKSSALRNSIGASRVRTDTLNQTKRLNAPPSCPEREPDCTQISTGKEDLHTNACAADNDLETVQRYEELSQKKPSD